MTEKPASHPVGAPCRYEMLNAERLNRLVAGARRHLGCGRPGNDPANLLDRQDEDWGVDGVAWLLNEHASELRASKRRLARLLGLQKLATPYVVGLAGSVASGKSTFSTRLAGLLSAWNTDWTVTVLSTDNFLLPSAAMKARGVMTRKGFPESYDRRRLLAFVEALSAGERNLSCPVYSRELYDIDPDKTQMIDQPDVLIIEGLNVLQTRRGVPTDTAFISEYFDTAVYLHADLAHLQKWYVERFVDLVRQANPNHSYYGQYRAMDDAERREAALNRWRAVNLPNLVKNIAPTKARADIILNLGADHQLNEVQISKHWL